MGQEPQETLADHTQLPYPEPQQPKSGSPTMSSWHITNANPKRGTFAYVTLPLAGETSREQLTTGRWGV